MQQPAIGRSDASSSLELAADENFLALAESTRDLVCTATLDGHVRFVNRAGCDLLGLAPSPRGSFIGQYVHADDQGLALRLLSEAVTQGRECESQLRFRHQTTGASVLMSCQIFRLKRHAGSEDLAAAVVGRTVTETADSATADRPVLAEAAATARLGEMFAGIVGHDLRNPLNAILTCAHFVTQQSSDDAVKATLRRIVSSGHRMQRMIDQLLDITRIRGGSGIPLHLTPLDLGAVAQQCVQEVSAGESGRAVQLQTRGDTTGQWDGDRMAQLISNLVGNAVQHGVRSSDVRVTIDGSSPDHVRLEVHNEGAIPNDLLPVLFNPFRILHQQRHKSNGLGLGLFISKQIAIAHGGDLTACSNAALGTTFEVRLPRQRPEHPSAANTGLGREDMAVLEMLARAPKATSVTAQLFGAVPLHERTPGSYWRIFERYARLLDVALDDQTYKSEGHELSLELRDIAEELGRLGAGAREVAELHARALRQKTRAVTIAKAQAFTSEGRLVSFELMGHLLSFYRRRAGLGVLTA